MSFQHHAGPAPDSPRPADIRLRRMRRTDIPEVVLLEEVSFANPWPKDFFYNCLARKGRGWILDQRGIVQGYCLVTLDGGLAHICNLCIRPAMRGLGLGRRLLSEVLERVRTRAGIAFLEVRVSNTVAIDLYQSLGFLEISRRKGYYSGTPNREDALVMALSFSEPAEG